MATVDAIRMSENRAKQRGLDIPKVFDPKRRAACEADDEEWLRIYLPTVFYNPFTNHQNRIIEDCGEVMRYGTKKCKAAPRGDGKSSIVKYLALKYSLARQLAFPLIVGATSSKARKLLVALKKRLAARAVSPLTQDYPLECAVARYVHKWPSRARNATANGRPVNVEWAADSFIVPTWEDEEPLGPILMALGATSDDLQGCNIYDIRPDFVLLDDLDSRDSLASEDGVVAGKIEETIDKTIAGMSGQSKPLGIFMLCTITSRSSAAFKYSDPSQKPAWSGERIAAIVKWPDRIDLWDEYVHLRKKGKDTLDAAKKAVDPFGRVAHQFYLDNYEAMNAGAVMSNPFNFEDKLLPDGSQKQVSALQRCYDYIADENMDSFMTEHQNDPPPDENSSRLILTSYHIQNNCLSGLERRHVPIGTVAITIGADIQKLGLHYVVIAWDEHGVGCIIDYDFFEFQTKGKDAADCELLILEGLFAWREALEESPFIGHDGEALYADRVLIDMGWKDQSWNDQPVQLFCAQAGFAQFMPSKGMSPYNRPKPTRHLVIGDNWHWDESQWTVFMNADHWKLKVHEGFLLERNEDGPAPGSLLLFDPPQIDGRRNRTFHLSYSKHVLAETWETRFMPGFRGSRTGWWKSPKPNHYFDATYQAIVGRPICGISLLNAPAPPVAMSSGAASPIVQPALANIYPVHTRNRW